MGVFQFFSQGRAFLLVLQECVLMKADLVNQASDDCLLIIHHGLLSIEPSGVFALRCAKSLFGKSQLLLCLSRGLESDCFGVVSFEVGGREGVENLGERVEAFFPDEVSTGCAFKEVFVDVFLLSGLGELFCRDRLRLERSARLG